MHSRCKSWDSIVAIHMAAHVDTEHQETQHVTRSTKFCYRSRLPLPSRSARRSSKQGSMSFKMLVEGS